VSADVDHGALIRAEQGGVLAILTRLTGRLDDAEDAFAEATIEALRVWPRIGVPERPGAWLTTVARRKAYDRIRREGSRPERERTAAAFLDDDPIGYSTLRDDQLRLFFVCCHPILSADAQVRLALRVIGGLTTAEIAAGFLEPEATTSKRITRAKAKIAANNVPFAVPADHELPARLHAVLSVISLVFTTGHHAPIGAAITRPDLLEEATRLSNILLHLMPDEPEVLGLSALLHATSARSSTFTHESGAFVSLIDADRNLWDRNQAGVARELVERALQRGRPGPFQIQAAISCLHSLAPTFAETDFRQIVTLYEVLEQMMPSVPVRLTKALAIAQLDGPSAGLKMLDGLRSPEAERSPFFHTASGHLREQLGERERAALDYARALDLTRNEADRAHLRRILIRLDDGASRSATDTRR
jgi:RNA polymerase sigma-70 factor, ECF subfamily